MPPAPTHTNLQRNTKNTAHFPNVVIRFLKTEFCSNILSFVKPECPTWVNLAGQLKVGQNLNFKFVKNTQIAHNTLLRARRGLLR